MKKLIVLAASLALGGCAETIKAHFHHAAPVVHVAHPHAAPAPVPAPVIQAAPAPTPVVVPVPAPAPKKARLLDRIKAKFHHKKDK